MVLGALAASAARPRVAGRCAALRRGGPRARPVKGLRLQLRATRGLCSSHAARDLFKPRVSFLDLEDPAYDEFELKLPRSAAEKGTREGVAGGDTILVEAQETVEKFQRRANVRVLDPEGYPVGPFVRMQSLLLLPPGGAAKIREADGQIEAARSVEEAAPAPSSGPLAVDADTARVIVSGSTALQLQSAENPSDTVRIAHLRAEDLLEAAAANAWAGESRDVETAQAEVAKFEHKLEAIEERKRRLDETALRSCKTRWWGAFVYLSVQNVVLAYGVWGVYSWDVMEPITYFIGSSVTLWGALYFAWLKRENNYDTLFNNMLARRRAAIYKGDGFSVDEVTSLRKAYRRALQHRDQVLMLTGSGQSA